MDDPWWHLGPSGRGRDDELSGAQPIGVCRAHGPLALRAVGLTFRAILGPLRSRVQPGCGTRRGFCWYRLALGS